MLPDDRTVKNWEEKLKNIGRPTIFIGSSLESKEIAEKVKASFPQDQFEVDIWYDGIFGKTRSTGGKMSNIEWLKNFTDIYDFAIFIFVPEDEIISKTRFDVTNKSNQKSARKALVTRHNVVFEFGMFLGRIGAKRSFILYEENKDTKDFIDLFFTDLKENLEDHKLEINEQFKIELYPYVGSYKDSVKNKFKTSALDNSNIEHAIERIKTQIKINFEDIDIGFLPGTSLAFGYFNNFIQIIYKSIKIIKSNEVWPESWIKQGFSKEKHSFIINAISKADTIKIKIVIPTSLEVAKQEEFNPDFQDEKFKKDCYLPGSSRLMPFYSLESCFLESDNSFVIYDVPSTLTSSIQAINILTPHEDIRSLLKEKERRNFKKAIEFKIKQVKDENLSFEIDEIVEIITREQFLEEVKTLIGI